MMNEHEPIRCSNCGKELKLDELVIEDPNFNLFCDLNCYFSYMSMGFSLVRESFQFLNRENK